MSLDAYPSQISSLLKLFMHPTPPGDKHGDGMEEAFLRVDPTEATVVVDVGLHHCENVNNAVRRGFIVHGFEPIAEHMQHCHRRLPPGSWFDVGIVYNSADGMPRAAVETRPPPRRQLNGTIGFVGAAFETGALRIS